MVALVYRSSEGATRQWMGEGFDDDTELLETILSGEVTRSRVGEYLESLKSRFPGELVADMLCLLRIHLELSIRAKGVLLARKAGFTLPPDPEFGARLAEIDYLENAIGPTGLLSLHPVRHMSDREIWQIHALAR